MDIPLEEPCAPNSKEVQRHSTPHQRVKAGHSIRIRGTHMICFINRQNIHN